MDGKCPYCSASAAAKDKVKAMLDEPLNYQLKLEGMNEDRHD